MKITSQLALSQIRLNKKRTIASIFAIALSTALMMAVMCFASSGNKMLTDFIGADYGSYAGAYSAIIAVPALFLGLLIAYMSVMVISNIFTTSANKRIREFGILKCVGGTRKQIRAGVIYESLWLSLIGIPMGLMLGTLIGYIGVRVTGHFVADINDIAKSIIMRPFSFALPFHISVWTYLVAAGFSFLIVLSSANKPAKAIGKLTAIQCVKGMAAGSALTGSKIEVKDRFAEKIFGSEGAIAYKNIRRNKTGYKATIRALSLGILLLLLTGGLSGQAKEFREWMTPDSREMMVEYCSIRDIETNPNTGKEEERIVAPIKASIYNEITKKLAEYGTAVYGMGSDACTYHALLSKDILTEDMLQAPGIFDEHNEMRLELVAVDDGFYRELCERAGASYGSNLMINDYAYNDHGRMKNLRPFQEGISDITIINAADELQKIPVGGYLNPEALKEQCFHEMNPYPVRIIMPGIDARTFSWLSMPGDEEDYRAYAQKVMDTYYPILTEDSYVEQGYTVRIARLDTMVKMLNVAIILAEIVLYGFVVLLIFMGFTSVVSTLATNIRIRSREFAILKSVGMTNASLRKMIYCESIICMIKACIPGVAFGIAIPFVINLSIRKAFPVLYAIPWGILLIGIGALFVTVMLITRLELNKLKDRSIIEEIRMDVM